VTSVSAESVPEQDPFAVFDEAVGIGQVPDPYPIFDEMRAECPVHKGRQGQRFGLDNSMDELLYGDRELYTVVDYESVQKVLRDNETYSSSIMEELNGKVMGHSIIEMDDPEHRRYRALIARAFTPHAMGRWEHDVVRPIVARMVDQLVGRERVDLARELFFPFPVHVIVEMMGLPAEDVATFHRKAAELILILVDIERGLAASQWLHDYFTGIIEDRRAKLRDDLISMLVEAELEGQKLTNEEIIAFLRLLLPAGAETTYRATSNLMVGLLQHPEQLAALRADRSLMPRVIEEGLRWEPPLTGASRLVMRDAEIDGVPICAGAGMHVLTGAANHDPTRWEHPERFDIFREPRSHLAFGFGQHVCLGMHLARLEMSVAIGEVLDRMPNVRLDPDAGDVQITGYGFRAPGRVPVLVDPA
jgi:cytochrome P450